MHAETLKQEKCVAYYVYTVSTYVSDIHISNKKDISIIC